MRIIETRAANVLAVAMPCLVRYGFGRERRENSRLDASRGPIWLGRRAPGLLRAQARPSKNIFEVADVWWAMRSGRCLGQWRLCAVVDSRHPPRRTSCRSTGGGPRPAAPGARSHGRRNSASEYRAIPAPVRARPEGPRASLRQHGQGGGTEQMIPRFGIGSNRRSMSL